MNTMQRMLAALLLTTSARQIEEGRRAKTEGEVGANPLAPPTSGLWGGHERPFRGRYLRSHGASSTDRGLGGFNTPAGQRKLARRAAAETCRLLKVYQHKEAMHLPADVRPLAKATGVFDHTIIQGWLADWASRGLQLIKGRLVDGHHRIVAMADAT